MTKKNKTKRGVDNHSEEKDGRKSPNPSTLEFKALLYEYITEEEKPVTPLVEDVKLFTRICLETPEFIKSNQFRISKVMWSNLLHYKLQCETVLLHIHSFWTSFLESAPSDIFNDPIFWQIALKVMKQSPAVIQFILKESYPRRLLTEWAKIPAAQDVMNFMWSSVHQLSDITYFFTSKAEVKSFLFSKHQTTAIYHKTIIQHVQEIQDSACLMLFLESLDRVRDLIVVMDTNVFEHVLLIFQNRLAHGNDDDGCQWLQMLRIILHVIFPPMEGEVKKHQRRITLLFRNVTHEQLDIISSPDVLSLDGMKLSTITLNSVVTSILHPYLLNFVSTDDAYVSLSEWRDCPLLYDVFKHHHLIRMLFHEDMNRPVAILFWKTILSSLKERSIQILRDAQEEDEEKEDINKDTIPTTRGDIGRRLVDFVASHDDFLLGNKLWEDNLTSSHHSGFHLLHQLNRLHKHSQPEIASCFTGTIPFTGFLFTPVFISSFVRSIIGRSAKYALQIDSWLQDERKNLSQRHHGSSDSSMVDDPPAIVVNASLPLYHSFVSAINHSTRQKYLKWPDRYLRPIIYFASQHYSMLDVNVFDIMFHMNDELTWSFASPLFIQQKIELYSIVHVLQSKKVARHLIDHILSFVTQLQWLNASNGYLPAHEVIYRNGPLLSRLLSNPSLSSRSTPTTASFGCCQSSQSHVNLDPHQQSYQMKLVEESKDAVVLVSGKRSPPIYPTQHIFHPTKNVIVHQYLTWSMIQYSSRLLQLLQRINFTSFTLHGGSEFTRQTLLDRWVRDGDDDERDDIDHKPTMSSPFSCSSSSSTSSSSSSSSSSFSSIMSSVSSHRHRI